jgi:hypothetical protein
VHAPKPKKIKKMLNRDLSALLAKKLYQVIKKYWTLDNTESKQLATKLIQKVPISKSEIEKRSMIKNFREIIKNIKCNTSFEVL